MIIDGFFIEQLTKVFDDKLKDARLEKIQQIDQSSFLFNFYRRGEKQKLMIHLLASDYRAYLTKNTYKNFEHSQFLVALKKHLEGGILKTVKQYLNDRVIIFDFIVSDYIFGEQQISLIFEAMGKHANLLIVKNNKIIETFKKMFFEEGRQLLPQADFEFFPVTKKSYTHIDYQVVESPKDITSTYMGISKKFAEYLYNHKLQVKDVDIKPTYDLTDNKFYIVDIFDDSHEKTYFDDINELIANYRFKKPISKQSYHQFIKKQLKKYQTKSLHLQQQLDKAFNQLAAKDKGDLIYMSGLNLSSYSHEIMINDQKLILDEHLTLNENAQKFYKKYQKAKRSIDPIEHQIKENNALIELFQEFQMYLEMSDALDLNDLADSLKPYGYINKKKKQMNKKKSYKPHIIEIKDLDATYYIGKNAVQNMYITHDLSQKNDDWFHVKDAPGSHVLVKCENLNEPIIRKAAMLAAYHSKMRYSSSIPVDYTKVSQIKKIPHKPGYQVIYKQNKTIFIDIDETLINAYLKNSHKL